VPIVSTNSPQFAVIEFTNAPPRTVMVSASSVANVVDCYGTLAVAGDFGGGKVTLFDIGNPKAPQDACYLSDTASRKGISSRAETLHRGCRYPEKLSRRAA